MKAVVAAFNQERALVGAFSVIVQPVVEPMNRFTALPQTHLEHGLLLLLEDRPLRGHAHVARVPVTEARVRVAVVRHRARAGACNQSEVSIVIMMTNQRPVL